jgi:hypothetical protein
MPATNEQIKQIIDVNEGTGNSTSAWEDGGETYQIEINNPAELYIAKQELITYAIEPADSVISPTTGDIQLKITAVRGDGAVLDSDSNPELFEWVNLSPTLIAISDTGLVSYVSGGSDDPADPVYAFAGGFCPALNPNQVESDAVIARFDVKLT